MDDETQAEEAEKPKRKFGEFTHEERLANLAKAQKALAEKRARGEWTGGRVKQNPTKIDAYREKLDELTPTAIKVLEEQLYDKDASVRQRAAIAILDRRYGKPGQTITTNTDDEKKVVYRSAVIEALAEGSTGQAPN